MNTTTDRPASNVAFVFEGGGSLAATQVGMLRALTEARPRPAMVIGTSAGAINAVAFAADPTLAGIAELKALWLSLHRRDLAALRALLEDHFADRRLEDTRIPAHVVTTDLACGAAHIISAGPIVEALLASAAIPGLFPSVTIDGRRLVDGALAANTPVPQAVDLGATDVYILAVATLGRTGELLAPADLALPAQPNMVDAATAHHSQGSPARVYLIPSPPSPTSNILEFRHSSELIAEAYQLARRWLADGKPAATAAA
jgi:NTE family protein